MSPLRPLYGMRDQHLSCSPSSAGDLFEVMATGGRVGFETVTWFNGGLFDDSHRVPLIVENLIDGRGRPHGAAAGEVRHMIGGPRGPEADRSDPALRARRS